MGFFVTMTDLSLASMDKDRLQHQLLLEEEKCRLHLSTIAELETEMENHIKSLHEIEEQHESLK